MNIHHYTLRLDWVGDASMSSTKNDRLYEIEIPGKPSFRGSADANFHGDPQLLNPEDLLLSALASCHMMSYFYVCRQNGITIKSYVDNPSGLLELKPDGSGRFTQVTLKPVLSIEKQEDIEHAKSLHEKASKLCFIANSCAFDILIDAVIQSDS